MAHLNERPTQLYELVSMTPVIDGTTDASGLGMGGIVFLPTELLAPRVSQAAGHPILWCIHFPTDIVQHLVMQENPNGDITNSDLELVAMVLQQDVIAQHYNVHECTTHTTTDNTPSWAWQHWGSISTDTLLAYLLCLQALHQWYHHYIPTYSYLPDKLNVMADDTTQLWKLMDDQLLTHFNAIYPQSLSWNIYHPTSSMTSAVISVLCKMWQKLELYLLDLPPLKDTGSYRLSFVRCSAWIKHLW